MQILKCFQKILEYYCRIERDIVMGLFCSIYFKLLLMYLFFNPPPLTIKLKNIYLCDSKHFITSPVCYHHIQISLHSIYIQLYKYCQSRHLLDKHAVPHPVPRAVVHMPHILPKTALNQPSLTATTNPGLDCSTLGFRSLST